MKKRTSKLTLHRETLRTLTRTEIARAQGRATTGSEYTLTCPLSGCYVCTGLGCTGNCPDEPSIGLEGP